MAAKQKKEDLATITRLKEQIQSLEKDKHDIQTRYNLCTMYVVDLKEDTHNFFKHIVKPLIYRVLAL